jgi:hypothetical protein
MKAGRELDAPIAIYDESAEAASGIGRLFACLPGRLMGQKSRTNLYSKAQTHEAKANLLS